MAEEEEQKVDPNQLNLKVVAQSGEEIFFKVKQSTKFSKIMSSYCTRQNIQSDAVRFLFDGDRIRPEQTPQDLGMENDDSIDVVVEQVGGGEA